MKKDLSKIDIKELAIFVGAELNKHGIDAVLVGGACVSIYSHNGYISGDLDYVSPSSTDKLIKALKGIGFYKKGEARQFYHNACPFFIEFPPGPISIGNEVGIEKFKKIKSLKLFTPTDCVKDRLAAFYYWNDHQSLDQAILVAKAQKVNYKEIEKWSQNEGSIEKYRRFLDLLKNEGK